MITAEERQLGRAKNAVMFYLERNLIVPKIYVDADWSGRHVDILAIDRDGVGDVHAVLLIPRKYLIDGSIDLAQEWIVEKDILDTRFQSIPAQYKYMGLVDLEGSRQNAGLELTASVTEKTFSPDGLGRVGFLKVGALSNEEPDVSVVIRPERFRAKIAKLADEYVQQHEADWEIRA